MLERIIIAGAGGQGIILLGKLIARIAALKTPYVTFFPAYGVEVRGGSAHCEVIFSSREIASPCAEQTDTLILMNQHGAQEMVNRLTSDGLALVNSSLCQVTVRPGQTMISLPATAMADQAGSIRSANLVMLGALLRHKPWFTVAEAEQIIGDWFSGPVKDVNLRALQAGQAHA